ncbi:TTF-type domain-containing protein [Trichonephila clavata]|uniref:TTF-type domain-containing protein n=1 Tax=Trichonephila clavata TaxID=2740835 RepID=A0A8X6JLQ4_TRICU|nr:TTF-type domain-containing protein [Trichonephila clavata]
MTQEGVSGLTRLWLYPNVIQASRKLYRSLLKMLQVIHEAKSLLRDLLKKGNIIMAGFLAVVLNRINGVDKSLKMKSIEFQTTVKLLESVQDFLNSLRELYYEYERKANEKIDSQYTDEYRRVRIRK